MGNACILQRIRLSASALLIPIPQLRVDAKKRRASPRSESNGPLPLIRVAITGAGSGIVNLLTTDCQPLEKDFDTADLGAFPTPDSSLAFHSAETVTPTTNSELISLFGEFEPSSAGTAN